MALAPVWAHRGTRSRGTVSLTGERKKKKRLSVRVDAEPCAFWLRGRESNPRARGYEPRERPLFYPAERLPSDRRGWHGARSRIRTDDLRITSAPLWPTELSGHGGESRIRTYGALSRTATFEVAALSLSAISPWRALERASVQLWMICVSHRCAPLWARMAERGGFEPPSPCEGGDLSVSNRPPSTTRPTLRFGARGGIRTRTRLWAGPAPETGVSAVPPPVQPCRV